MSDEFEKAAGQQPRFVGVDMARQDDITVKFLYRLSEGELCEIVRWEDVPNEPEKG